MTNPQDISLRIGYAIQNVGGIDFSHDVGDTVPVKQTLLGLRRAGHQVTCLQLQGRKVVAIEDVSNSATALSLPLGLSGTRPFLGLESGFRRLQRVVGLPYFAFFDAYRFYEACYRHLPGYDLCHEHNGLFCVGAALACQRLRLPYVLTFSADPLFERALGGRPLRGLHRLVAAWEAKFTYRLASKIICVSEPAKQHLIKSWGVNPEKVIVMPNGDDLDLFQPAYDPRPIRTELGLNGEPVIGFVGGFQHWHGLERLVESLAQVRSEVPNAKLLLVGDGRARPSIERKIAELGQESAVVITGLVPQKRVPEMLAVADVAVLPYPKLSRELWFSPLKLYEYMASGKAIVASRDGQIAEVIQDGHNGLLVDPDNMADLTQALIRLLGDPAERARLGHNARRQAIEQHSWNQYIKRLEKIYLSVLHCHPLEHESAGVSL
jgi:glycosyltransferase involved in cell wall biosynthesis